MGGRVYAFREVWESTPDEKRRSDSMWTRLILRPTSVPLTWLVALLGVTPNHVTYVAALLCVAAALLMALGDRSQILTGTILFNLFAALDCGDDNLARLRAERNEFGDLVTLLRSSGVRVLLQALSNFDCGKRS